MDGKTGSFLNRKIALNETPLFSVWGPAISVYINELENEKTNYIK